MPSYLLLYYPFICFIETKDYELLKVDVAIINSCKSGNLLSMVNRMVLQKLIIARFKKRRSKAYVVYSQRLVVLLPNSALRGHGMQTLSISQNCSQK